MNSWEGRFLFSEREWGVQFTQKKHTDKRENRLNGNFKEKGSKSKKKLSDRKHMQTIKTEKYGRLKSQMLASEI